jgi:hypothetical protein
MKLIFLVISVILSLMLAPPLLNAFAASDQEHYSAGWRDGENTAQSDFNSGVQYQTADTHCADHHTKQYCSGYWAGYADEWNRSIQANSHTEKTPNPASNPPASNSILNPPTTTSSPTTYSWVGPFIIFVIVVVIIAKIAHKIKHRKGKYRERQYFSESVKENILDKQHHKCAHCNRLLNVVDYDHEDGDRSNNKESNCVALCPNCHAVKTRSTR